MQAPPTSGSPAQDRRVLVCPACRALNAGDGGAFCWQCFRPFNGREAIGGTEAAGGTTVAVPPPPPAPVSAVRGVSWTPRTIEGSRSSSA